MANQINILMGLSLFLWGFQYRQAKALANGNFLALLIKLLAFFVVPIGQYGLIILNFINYGLWPGVSFVGFSLVFMAIYSVCLLLFSILTMKITKGKAFILANYILAFSAIVIQPCIGYVIYNTINA